MRMAGPGWLGILPHHAGYSLKAGGFRDEEYSQPAEKGSEKRGQSSDVGIEGAG